MDAEQKAREITSGYRNTLNDEAEPYVRQDIIDALRQARAEGRVKGLEEAERTIFAACDDHGPIDGLECVRHIRALKDKEPT